MVLELPPEAHLCEVDWSVFGNTVSIFTGKHPTVTSIHLLWNFLKEQNNMVLSLQASFLLRLKNESQSSKILHISLNSEQMTLLCPKLRTEAQSKNTAFQSGLSI